jgi:hypothetical protein
MDIQYVHFDETPDGTFDMNQNCTAGFALDCAFELIATLAVNFDPQRACACRGCAERAILVRAWNAIMLLREQPSTPQEQEPH